MCCYKNRLGGFGPQSNTWFPGPTKVLNPNSILIDAAVFAGLTSMTDRLTDHATWSVTIGRIYVRCTVMQPNNDSTNSSSSTLRVPIPVVPIVPSVLYCVHPNPNANPDPKTNPNPAIVTIVLKMTKTCLCSYVVILDKI